MRWRRLAGPSVGVGAPSRGENVRWRPSTLVGYLAVSELDAHDVALTESVTEFDPERLVVTRAPGMALDAALTSWLLTFAPDAPASATLRDFADGEVLLAVAQDVVDGFDFAAAPGGAAGALAALEAAFGVRREARARA
jgi:hypothetical protein